MKYVLELWNPISKKYEKIQEYDDPQRAEIMFDKPYFRTYTRRLVRVQSMVILKARKNHYG